MTEHRDNAIQDDPQISGKVRRGQIARKLLKLLFWIWVIAVLCNLIVGAVFMGIQMRLGDDTMVRADSGHRYGSGSWPANPPLFAQWPDPKHVVKFRSSTPFVSGFYAVSWDSEGRRYTMDVLSADFLSRGFAVRKIRVISFGDDGEAVEIQQSNWVMMPPDLIEMLVNSLILSVDIWVLIGLIPLWARVSRRREAERERVKNLNCLECEYDILDLRICPECGTPTHRIMENDDGLNSSVE